MLTLREQWIENQKRRKEGRPEVDREGNEYPPKKPASTEPKPLSKTNDWADHIDGMN